MTALLCAIFFLSGAAALLFESLWFRQAGLAFGNGVVASSVVLGSFMAGLAIGNGIAARARRRFLRPVTAYAALELVIAATGVALVIGLPELGRFIAPLARPLVDAPLLHNLLRLTLAFTLLLVPATAMGLTLPLLVQALEQRSAGFGAALGRLYGWNTLGAVAGALVGEMLLIERFGVRGTAFAAAGFNALAALGAAGFARAVARESEPAAPPDETAPAPIGWAAWLCLAATFLAGGTLLALEVVWFRLLHLFVHGGDYLFAVILATVLTGIALGGLAGGAWLRRDRHAGRHAAAVAWAAGFGVVLLYRAFPSIIAPFGVRYLSRPSEALFLAAFLTLPVSFLSGLLFPMLGERLREHLAPARRAAGLLALYNTAGSALGSIAGGFVLLPFLGMERSLFALAIVYGVAGALAAAGSARAPEGGRHLGRFVVPALYVAALALFPFGQVQGFLELVVERNTDGQQLAAVREGRLETIQYTRRDYLGEPLNYQLLTDGFSMAGTAPGGRRYMKLYTWWPVAFAPPPKRALLISFGVGSTAKSLTDTPSLERIDVVDISREILALSDLVYPDPADHPLKDPRVHVHVEDGRNFLLNSDERWDLITGEPPPPKNAGVVNLYSREYFELVREHLTPGGIHTYWLPVMLLTEADARSIVAAYCAAFPDCSLWGGTDFDWMLIGTNGARWTRDEEKIAAQWADPRVAAELRAVGLERPEQLASLFMADAAQLRERVAGAPPVTDDFPKRLSDFPSRDQRGERKRFEAWMDAGAARERFAASAFVRDVMPDGLRERSLPYFAVQALMNGLMAQDPVRPAPREQMQTIDWILTETDLRTPVLWLLGITADQLRIVDAKIASGAAEDGFLAELAVRDLAERRYASAAERFRRILEQRPDDRLALSYRAYALARSGRAEEARAEVARFLPQAGAERPYWTWIARSIAGPEPRFR